MALAYVATVMFLLAEFLFHLLGIIWLVKDGFTDSGFIILVILDIIVAIALIRAKPINAQKRNEIARRTKQMNDYTDEFGIIEWEDK